MSSLRPKLPASRKCWLDARECVRRRSGFVQVRVFGKSPRAGRPGRTSYRKPFFPALHRCLEIIIRQNQFRVGDQTGIYARSLYCRL
jgi:hypothetical protein